MHWNLPVAFIGAMSVFLYVKLDIKWNPRDMAFFVRLSRVTLSPWSCDLAKTAKTILKYGFVRALQIP